MFTAQRIKAVLGLALIAGGVALAATSSAAVAAPAPLLCADIPANCGPPPVKRDTPQCAPGYEPKANSCIPPKKPKPTCGPPTRIACTPPPPPPPPPVPPILSCQPGYTLQGQLCVPVPPPPPPVVQKPPPTPTKPSLPVTGPGDEHRALVAGTASFGGLMSLVGVALIAVSRRRKRRQSAGPSA